MIAACPSHLNKKCIDVYSYCFKDFPLYAMCLQLFVIRCSCFSFSLFSSPAYFAVTAVMDISRAALPSALFSSHKGSLYYVMEYISRYVQYLDARRFCTVPIVSDQQSLYDSRI